MSPDTRAPGAAAGADAGTRGVVFAYHEVGVRCLQVLIDAGLRIPLVVTHRDDPAENRWFASVAELAARHGIPVRHAEDLDDAALAAAVRDARPDFIFSFYYRRMLPVAILELATHGAYNMHGSLLPRYRGRVPVNWAVLHGEPETGATLHEMVAKPDAGRIAGQEAVPIGPDDTAAEVFARVTGAAERVLRRALPGLVDGSLKLEAQNLALGSYFGGRRPEDGRIDWRQNARSIHNLVRAVAPPYPGAYTELDGARLYVYRTRVIETPGERPAVLAPRPALLLAPEGAAHVGAICADGSALALLELALDGRPLGVAEFALRFGRGPLFPA